MSTATAAAAEPRAPRWGTVLRSTPYLNFHLPVLQAAMMVVPATASQEKQEAAAAAPNAGPSSFKTRTREPLRRVSTSCLCTDGRGGQ